MNNETPFLFRFKNGEEILDEERRKVIQRNLAIKTPLRSDIGTYVCRVEDAQRRLISEGIVELRGSYLYYSIRGDFTYIRHARYT